MAQIVILSTADMNAAVWTNKQHLAVRLSENHDVVYIESLGLRRPKLTRSDVQRMWGRLFRRNKKDTTAITPSRLKVVSPHVVPIHNMALVRAVNTALLRRQVKDIVANYDGKSIFWSFSPVTYGIEDTFDAVVYHSVDLLHELEGLPKEQLLKAEENFASKADAVIASSREVMRHVSKVSPTPVTLWENVADTELYNSVTCSREPRAVFAGNLTPGKVDFALLRSLANAGIDLVLAGPIGIDGVADTDGARELMRHPKVTHVGNLPPQELATLLNSCTVGLIPYSINPYTVGVFPMKVYEYLASGLTVVSTLLPSLENTTSPSIIKAEGPNFIFAVKDNLSVDDEIVDSNRQQAEGHSWTMRTADAVRLIKDLVEVDV